MATSMKRIAAKNVDEYIQAFPPPVSYMLEKLRKTIKSAAPKAEEVISYGIAGYKYHGS